MAGSRSESLLCHLHRWLGSTNTPVDDGRMLERFVHQRDEQAFAQLVSRHGPLVFGICRRVLGRVQDAEDVFQATFLVLARKAKTIRKPESLSCFLHGVAYRLALKARNQSERRRIHERQAASPNDSAETDLPWREVRGLLDEELQRLPEKQRLPLVLCYLEGLTQDEASRRLGWPRGTLKRRLEAGRDRLRILLTHRGVTLGAGLFAAALSESATRGAVSEALRSATVRSSMQFLTNETALAATPAALLAEGALRSMLTTKLKLGAMLILALSWAAMAAGLAIPKAPVEDSPKIKAEVPSPARPAEETQVRKDLYGDPLPKGAKARLGTLRLRHQSMTASAVFTRNGKTAIVGDGDGNIVYWEVAAGKEIRRLPKLPGVIHALAITRDGKTLAAGVWGKVLLWEVAAGKLISQIEVKNDSIMQLLFTPDGKTLAIRYQGDVINLLDVAGDTKLRELKGHSGRVSSMDLSPDGKTLASGSWQDPNVRLWDVATGKEKLHFTTGGRDVLSVAFSPDGKRLAAISNLAGFAFFDPTSGKQLQKVKEYYGGVSQIAYAPDGKILAGLEANRTVHIMDASSGKHLREFGKTPRSMAGFTISPDGKTIATFWGGAHACDLWDMTSGKLLHPAWGHRMYITSIAFSADGREVFSAAGISDLPSQVWDARTGDRRTELGENPNSVNGLSLSPDGKLLAACGFKDIHLWDIVARKEVRSLKGHTNVIWSVFWSADDKTLVSGSYYDKSIRIWDAATGKQLRVIDAKQDWPAAVVLSPDGKIVAAGGYQHGLIRLWSAETGKELRSIKTSDEIVYTLAFSPDGSSLASGGMSGTIHFWEPSSGRLLTQWETKSQWTSDLAYSLDGRTLVSGHNDGSVRLWEVASGKERACFTGHRGGVRAVAISRDGRSIASGSEDTTVLVWDTTGGTRAETALSAEQLETLWRDLMNGDAARASRSMWRMALSPKQALPFLGERLRPVARLDAARQRRADQLLKDLDSDQFAVRQDAENELEKLGSTIEPALRKGLEDKPALEVRRRIEALLAKLGSERLRITRALELIEHMNTPAARRLVESLADGEPHAWLTTEARLVRKRLAEQPVTAPER